MIRVYDIEEEIKIAKDRGLGNKSYTNYNP